MATEETLPLHEASRGSSHFASQDGILSNEELMHSTRLRSLILAKEKELYDINEFRVTSLEQMVRDRDRLLEELTAKLKKLKEDFQYNLGLIEERDAELDRYDVTFGQLKDGLDRKEKEVSELKMTIAEIEQQNAAQNSRTGDMEAQYQVRIQELRGEVDVFRTRHEEALRKGREEMQALRYDLEGQLRQKQQEMEVERRDVTGSYEELMRQRETEQREREEEMVTRMRQLEREVGLKTRALQKSEASEKRAQEEAATVVALINEKQDLQSQLNRLGTEHEGKLNELLETLHAVEQAYAAQKDEYEQDIKRREASHDELYKNAVRRREAKLDSLKAQLSVAEERASQAEMVLRNTREDLEAKLVSKARELDIHQAQVTLEMEMRENASTSLKTQLWDAEAEMKVCKAKVKELNRAREERMQEIERLRVEEDHLRKAAEERSRAHAAKFEEMRQEYEDRLTDLEEKQKEVTRHAQTRVDAGRDEMDLLRRNITELEAQLLSKHEMNADLRARATQLESELAARQARRPYERESPQFSEDMGAASPLYMSNQRREYHSTRPHGINGMSAYDQAPPPSPIIQQTHPYHAPQSEQQQRWAGAAFEVLHQENERLRTAVSDMRQHMESLQRGQGRSPTSGRRSQYQVPPPPHQAPGQGMSMTRLDAADQQEDARLQQMAAENQKLRQDNKKLSGTCDKLINISNELNSRISKLSSTRTLRQTTSLPSTARSTEDEDGTIRPSFHLETYQDSAPPQRSPRPPSPRASTASRPSMRSYIKSSGQPSRSSTTTLSSRASLPQDSTVASNRMRAQSTIEEEEEEEEGAAAAEDRVHEEDSEDLQVPVARPTVPSDPRRSSRPSIRASLRPTEKPAIRSSIRSMPPTHKESARSSITQTPRQLRPSTRLSVQSSIRPSVRPSTCACPDDAKLSRLRVASDRAGGNRASLLEARKSLVRNYAIKD